MAYTGTKQVVIDKTSQKAKRWGFCDMENDGSFDAETEEIVELDFTFTSSLDDNEWTWNGSSFVEGGAPDVEPSSRMVQQIDINNRSKSSSWKTLTRIIYLGSNLVGLITKIEAIDTPPEGPLVSIAECVDKDDIPGDGP